MQILTDDRFLEILLQSAGGESPLGPADLDTPFAALGYDSLALLETLAKIERQFDVILSDEIVVDALSPREMLDLVNGHLNTVSP